MNNLLLLIFLLISPLLALAQPKWEVQAYISNPMKDNINISWFNIDRESIDDHELYHKSYSAGIILQHSYNAENSFRLRTGISRTNILEINRALNDFSHGKQDIIHLAPGWIYNIRMKKLNCYLGFEGQFNIHGQFKAEILELGFQHRIEVSGGYSAGVGTLSGFQFSLGKLFYLGSEINPYLLYSNTGNNSRMYHSESNTLLSQTKDKDFGITRFGIRFSILAGIKIGKRMDVVCPAE